MNSMIDEILKQQKLYEKTLGGSSIAELLRETNIAADLFYKQKGLGIPDWFDELKGLSSKRQLIKAIEDSSPTAQLFKVLDRSSLTAQLLKSLEDSTSLAQVTKSLDAAIGYTAIEQARKLLEQFPRVPENSFPSMVHSIGGNSLHAALDFKQLSGLSGLMKELAATENMLKRSDWAAVTAQTLRAFESGLIDTYSIDSLYRELQRTFDVLGEQAPSTAEAEASSIFDAIIGYLSKNAKKLTLHNFKAVSELVFMVVLHIYLSHHLVGVVKETIQEEMEVQGAKMTEAVNEHTAAVAEALWEKIERKLEELAEQAEEIHVLKWSTRDSAAIVRIAPESGSKRLGELLPGQVVVQFDDEGKWVQVEFQDHKAGVPRLGWVLKKHLTRMTPRRVPHSK